MFFGAAGIVAPVRLGIYPVVYLDVSPILDYSNELPIAELAQPNEVCAAFCVKDANG